MSLGKYLSERKQGKYPLSLSTSLAIESITDENIKQATKYDELWINITTLTRNIFTSLDLDSQNQLNDQALANVAIDEIDNIDSIVRDTLPNTRIVYYLNTYEKLKTIYKGAKFKEAKTPKQKFYKALLDNTYENIHDYYSRNKKIKSFNLKIEPSMKTSAIFLTHSPIDLTNSKHFKEIILLESYTGKLKDKTQWYTKFHSKVTPNVPLTISMLSIFGDSEVFYPQAKRYQETVLEIAEKHKWNCITTNERIKLTLGYIQDRETREFLLKFIHS